MSQIKSESKRTVPIDSTVPNDSQHPGCGDHEPGSEFLRFFRKFPPQVPEGDPPEGLDFLRVRQRLTAVFPQEDVVVFVFVQVFGEHELVVFRPGLARRIGPLPALLLCQACYWQGVAGVGEWWHKLRDADRDAAGKLLPPKNRDRQSWEWELGIGRSEQQICRRVLRDQNLIEEKLVGIPARLHFRVDVERLAEFLIDDTRPDAFSRLDGDASQGFCGQLIATRFLRSAIAIRPLPT